METGIKEGGKPQPTPAQVHRGAPCLRHGRRPHCSEGLTLENCSPALAHQVVFLALHFLVSVSGGKQGSWFTGPQGCPRPLVAWISYGHTTLASWLAMSTARTKGSTG